MRENPSLRRCSRCGGFLPLAEFGVNRSRSSGLKNVCRECTREQGREYYAANRERLLAKARKPPPVRHCTECGTELDGQRRIVCSPRCQERRRYRLNPEAAMEKQRRKRARRKERTA
jgi:hypothetical protein